MLQSHLDMSRFRRLLIYGFIALTLLVALALLYSVVVVPILVGAFLTYLLKPLVDQLYRWHVPKTLAISCMVGGSVLLSTLAVVNLVPIVIGEGRLILARAPQAFSVISSSWLPYLQTLAMDSGMMDHEQASKLLAVNNLLATLGTHVQQHLGGIWQTSSSLLTGIFYLVLLPLVTFFLLKDWADIKHTLRKTVPQDLRPAVVHLLGRLDHTLKNVLKGQVTVAAILGLLYVIGLSVVGLQFSVAIGIIAGICRLIPYMDLVVGGALSGIVLASNFTDWTAAIKVVAVFVLVQVLDGVLITPRVIGERIGLHPLVVILTVLALGDRFGFWGVLLAVPVAAVLKVLIEEIWPFYKLSRLYESSRSTTV